MDYNYSNKSKNETPFPRERAGVGIKVCGMQQNTIEVASLKPDYLGFIFWEPSKRFFNGPLPDLPHGIKKVGVFVDASLKEITKKVAKYNLLAVQLHGKESAEFCASLREESKGIQIIKVFSIKDDFDFGELTVFEEVCDFYLFDTKGRLPGGNGYTFNWEVLKKYPSTKPYFLSGGIGLEETEKIYDFLASPESKYCHAIDVNSRFEIEPGLKDVNKLSEFKTLITDY